jgi:RNA-directed DNA polymerase
MLRSRSNALLSVKRVTEDNAGRATAGVDGHLAVDSPDKSDLARWVQHRTEPWTPRPVKRVHIPKSNGRTRPLGIPVIADRCLQALVAAALEPEWEARFEPKSYGFRPGRGCHDAIVAIHTTSSGKNATRLWALDADLKEAFDRLSHDHILDSLGSFPARDLVRRWLSAGVIENGRMTPTGEGTPQGGVISPLLMNVALHGMERAAGVRYYTSPSEAGNVVRTSPVLVRYADDFLVLCRSYEQAEEVKSRLAVWLEPRGLVFNEDKTQITHLDEGVDFLGFNIRRFRGKLLTKPSKEAVKKIRARLSQEMRSLRGANADAVVERLNPIVKGWAAYFRIGASKRTFNALDTHVWKLVYKWARYSHPNKSAGWVITRYFGMFHPSRRNKWLFGSQKTGRYVRKFAWTPIVRHRMVAGASSPDDPSLSDYWARRRRRTGPPVGNSMLWLLKAQRGGCPICGELLLAADHEPQSPQEWEQWFRAVRKAIRWNAVARADEGKSDTPIRNRLVHARCHRKERSRRGGGPAVPTASKPKGLA